MPAAAQVANWIVRYRDESGAPVDPMSLQKLMFYAQAFCLARHGEPLFSARFKAWKRGPVIPHIWHEFPANEAGLIVPADDDRHPQIDDEFEKCVYDAVLYFSRLNPFQLSNATHNEEPWLNARGGRPWYEPSDEPISEESMRIYYSGLIADGEDALSRHEYLDRVPEPRIGYFYRCGICVRGMTEHPLYNLQLAEALAAPVEEEETLPNEIFAPLKKREFISADEL